MRKLIVASNNINKINEIKDILKEMPLKILSLKEAGINIDVEENGQSFMENALIKAKAIHDVAPGAMVLADDSGLTVDSLAGAPGIYSARFSGEHGNDRKNNIKLLELLNGKKEAERKGQFVCAIALITHTGEEVKVEGRIEGIIIEEERGSNGFGYDPVFYIEEYGKTFGELDGKTKNRISHRAKALKELQREIIKLLGEV